VLALEFIGHADVKVPGIFLVGAAFQNALNDFTLVNNQSVFQVENSLLPVCMPRPATNAMLSTDVCFQKKGIQLFSTAVKAPASDVASLVAQHSTAQHSTAQHSTAQHSTAQHSTAQHRTGQGRTGHSAAQSWEQKCRWWLVTYLGLVENLTSLWHWVKAMSKYATKAWM